MGCQIQKQQQNQSQLKKQKEKSSIQQSQKDNQSKKHITNSPPSYSKTQSPFQNPKELTQKQQIKIQEVIFNKKKTLKQTTLLKVDEQYKFQQTLIGLIRG
ncbi:unnamed protein product [Paramecium sonneborni]|uniref:Uncharacterized protein n=1 Tax=Paramecium sonneborni TaxID=65129 RepID=A0A8S1QUB9_9CILI|nr:unnamed protein product [Paramecium sonneborni]